MTNREQFEAFLIGEYEWAEGALNAAIFCGDDATGHYVCGEHIYDRQDCSECLFWAWRGWQAASKASEQKLAAVVAENVGLKSKGREVLNKACKVYEKINATIRSDSGDFIDGQTLHEFQFLLDVETPATDALLAGIRAQGVDMYADTLDRGAGDAERDGFDDGMKFLRAEAEAVRKFAAQLRQGVAQ